MSKHEHEHKSGAGGTHKEHTHAWKVRHGQVLPIWNIVILVALGVLLLATLVVVAFWFFG